MTREYMTISPDDPANLDAACPDCGAVVYDTAQHDEFHKWIYPRDKNKTEGTSA